MCLVVVLSIYFVRSSLMDSFSYLSLPQENKTNLIPNASSFPLTLVPFAAAVASLLLGCSSLFREEKASKPSKTSRGR